MSSRIWPWARQHKHEPQDGGTDPRTEALKVLRQAEVGLAQAQVQKAHAVAQK